MLSVPYLKIFTAFSLFILIIGDAQNITTSVDIDYKTSVVDGLQYIKRLVNGNKVSEKPGILMFTAPYKLCEGGCNDNDGDNIALEFPLYIGKSALNAYKNIYYKDHKKLHKDKPNAPFKRSTTRATTTITTPTTTSPTTTTIPTTCKIITIIQMVTTEPPPTTMANTLCPFIPFGMCLKKIKQKNNLTTTKFPTIDVPKVDIMTQSEQEEQDNLNRLLLSKVKQNQTNYVQRVAFPPTISVFREINGEPNSNFFLYDELSNNNPDMPIEPNDESKSNNNNEVIKFMPERPLIEITAEKITTESTNIAYKNAGLYNKIQEVPVMKLDNRNRKQDWLSHDYDYLNLS